MTQRNSLFILLLCLGLFAQSATAQSRNRDEDKFVDHLWYGGGAGLGFQSFNNQSSFLLAIYPMVAYKITEEFSAGPRLGLTYQYIKSLGFNGEVYQFHPVELSAAIFGRMKIFQQFFGHLEYEITSEKDPIYVGGVPTIIKSSANNFYVGGGFNAGGKFSTEIYMLYNVLQDANSLDVPFNIRFGFTFNY